MSETDTTTGTGGSRVRVARERKGLTQAELAERVGCHVLTVKRWEHGTHKPGTPELAQQLAAVLDQPLEWLFPPEEHAYVRDARTRHPGPAAGTAPAIPDPRDVLATLQPRPGRRPRPARLATTFALLAAGAAIAITVVAATGLRHTAPPAATSSPARTLAPAVDAIDPPTGAEQIASRQAEPAATIQATRTNRHARHATGRRRAAASRRHRAHPLRRARSRSTQPTYPASAATSPVSQAAAPAAAGTQPAVATNTTAASATTTTTQQPASSSATQPVAAAPDGPGEFDGP